MFQNEDCIASGPGKDMFDSTRIIGEMQFNKAKVCCICICTLSASSLSSCFSGIVRKCSNKTGRRRYSVYSSL